MTNWWRKWRIK